eukprot:scaffold3822_cov142-Isochrysis_galbana.AAC.8
MTSLVLLVRASIDAADALAASACPSNCALNLHYVWCKFNEELLSGRHDVPDAWAGSVRDSLLSTVGDACSVTIHVHTPRMIHTILLDIDPELAALFSRINPVLPAMVADVGRIAVVYKYGGMYLDFSMAFASQEGFCSIVNLLSTHDGVFDQPTGLKRIRNSAFAAPAGSPLLKESLMAIKKNMLAVLSADAAGKGKLGYNQRNGRLSVFFVTGWPFIQLVGQHMNGSTFGRLTKLRWPVGRTTSVYQKYNGASQNNQKIQESWANSSWANSHHWNNMYNESLFIWRRKTSTGLHYWEPNVPDTDCGAIRDAPALGKPLPSLQYREDLSALLEYEKMHSSVEIGVLNGGFSQQILKHWPSCTSYMLVDLWAHQDTYTDNANRDDTTQQYRMEGTLKRLASYGDKIKVCRNYSTVCALRIPPSSLDFVYVDARHDYKGALADIKAYWPLLRPGGIMAGHDYMYAHEHSKYGQRITPSSMALKDINDYSINEDGSYDKYHRAVKEAVDEFFTRCAPRAIGVTYHEHNYNTWFVRR